MGQFPGLLSYSILGDSENRRFWKRISRSVPPGSDTLRGAVLARWSTQRDERTSFVPANRMHAAPNVVRPARPRISRSHARAAVTGAKLHRDQSVTLQLRLTSRRRKDPEQAPSCHYDSLLSRQRRAENELPTWASNCDTLRHRHLPRQRAQRFQSESFSHRG